MDAAKPLIVSAPFGNYIQPSCATATLGTYTAAARPGRLWRILKTVRYYPRLGAWVNKIGLRNPGIDHLAAQVSRGKVRASDKILSIHGFSEADWSTLIEKAALIAPMAIELNISCPNVGEVSWPADLFSRAVGSGVPVVVKVPPVRYERVVDEALGAGVRWLHCCNTLPVPAGGMSGRPLLPISLRVVQEIRARADSNGVTGLRIIGGGGVRSTEDAAAYRQAGADLVAVGTLVFGPRYLSKSHTERVLAPIAKAASQPAPEKAIT
jgi:dihydroorotate dehydrogenase